MCMENTLITVRARKFSSSHLYLLSLWFLLLFESKRRIEFSKWFEDTCSILSKNPEFIELIKNHYQLLQFYEANRPSFWFEFIEAIEYGLLEYCRDQVRKSDIFVSSEVEMLDRTVWTKRIIESSPFPRDAWIHDSSGRRILRTGNRVIICE